MFNSKTDREWERFGATDPYFGVLTEEKFHKSNLTDANKDAFFESGYVYIADIVSNIKKHIDPTFNPRNTLDFGCGVGRLVVPLAEISENVVGVDVSESMLSEAKRNCDSRSITNASFAKADGDLSSLKGKFDFIHSIIVFQHIPVKIGERIFKNLLAHLDKGGIGVLHITYAATKRYRRGFVSLANNHIPLGPQLINLIRGEKLFAPTMQMNTYDMNNILVMMQERNVRNIYAEYTDHGGHLGLLIYFKGP